jgi:hypothetical protein
MCPRTDGACAVIFADEYTAEKICDKPAWVLGTAVRHNAAFTNDVSLDGLVQPGQIGDSYATCLAVFLP